MPKAQKSKRENKKQAVMSPKEKKAAKLAKKQAGNPAPMLLQNS